MKNILFKFLKILTKFDLFLLLRLLIQILKKNYSKYPYYVEEFENELASRFNSKFCLTFSSGTAAFYASLLSLNLGNKSKVLISSLTFPTVIQILKKYNYEIYYFDLDENFEIISDNIEKYNYDLVIITHPFGFYIDCKKLKKFLSSNTKVIFDSSHSQGINIDGKSHMKLADISFMSLQGSKAISGGEGGVIFTDNESIYLDMINNHHPGHKKNRNSNIAGGIGDLKLRMHPIAALLAKNDLRSFDKRNIKLTEKIKIIYKHLDHLEIEHPFNKDSNIGGFHFGIPFYFKRSLSSKLIKSYNWHNDLSSMGINSFSEKNENNLISNLCFLDLEWIKNNNIFIIKSEINKIFKDAS